VLALWMWILVITVEKEDDHQRVMF
jgi:hypothetical protein